MTEQTNEEVLDGLLKAGEDIINPFELQVGGPEGIDNADVPVRWCITTNMVSQMEKDGIVDPHILLVSYNPKHDIEMARVLVPVGELMTYVRFSKAGTMKLFGWIINGEPGRRQIKKEFLGKERGVYNTDLIFGGSPEEDIKGTYMGTAREVEIPSDVFGAEPPAQLKWLANLWTEDRIQDECHFRRRLIFALTIKWVFVLLVGLISVFFRVLTNTALTLGGWWHNTRWKYCWRPYK